MTWCKSSRRQAMEPLRNLYLQYFVFMTFCGSVFVCSMCVLILFLFATDVDLADKNLQISSTKFWPYSNLSLDDGISLRDKFLILFDGYQKMVDHSFSKSKDLGDMLRFLPGIVVQKDLSMQRMSDLYGIKPDFLKRLESIGLLRLAPASILGYVLDGYLSGFLQDRDRSQLYYSDPELQHISICRQILSLSYQSNVFGLQS